MQARTPALQTQNVFHTQHDKQAGLPLHTEIYLASPPMT